MAYFSNGCSGDSFQAAYCDRCALQDGCAVWSIHLQHNYSQHPEHTKTPEEKGAATATHQILDALIGDDGCRMFHQITDDELATLRKKYAPKSRFSGVDKPAPWIEEWLSKRQHSCTS